MLSYHFLNICCDFKHTAALSTADFSKRNFPFLLKVCLPKAKEESTNTKTDTDSNNPNLKLQSTPDIQVQNTKFDGIVLLSPAAQQLQKDLDSAIKDNISSTTKQKHGSINHLQMRKLMDPDKGVNELAENLVNKLKA